MGLLGKIFPRRRGEEKLNVPPEQRPGKQTPKAPVHRSGAPRTRKQIRARKRAMVGRKVNRKRLIKEAS